MARRAVAEQPTPVALRVGASRFFLTVLPERFLPLDRTQRQVALEHQLLHVALGHPVRATGHPGTPLLFVAACDLVVNQLVSSGHPLPGSFTLTCLPPPERIPDLSVEQYLSILRRLYPSGEPPAGKSGCCGSGSGHPWADPAGRPGNPVDGDRRLPWDAAAAQPPGPTSNRSWRRLLTGRAAGPGDQCLPRSGRTSLSCSMPVMASWTGGGSFGCSRRAAWRSRIRGTLRRPSRRYHTFPGIRVARGQRMAVCVDTSGSVGDRELAEFFAEVHAIWRAGAEVVVFEADAAVHRTWEYTGQPPAAAHGRGGTSFDAALAAVRAANPRFDACVYLTDGHAPGRRQAPAYRCCGS